MITLKIKKVKPYLYVIPATLLLLIRAANPYITPLFPPQNTLHSIILEPIPTRTISPFLFFNTHEKTLRPLHKNQNQTREINGRYLLCWPSSKSKPSSIQIRTGCPSRRLRSSSRRFNRRLKIAIRGIVSEFDETSFIGSVVLFYYRISSFVTFRAIVWPYDFKT